MHTQLIKSGFVFRVVAASYLAGLYAKCNSFWEAEMPERDVESWNTVISCNYHDGKADKGVWVGAELSDIDCYYCFACRAVGFEKRKMDA
jgi:hypothetical protein